jgi:lipopolysaccharide export system protein LptA
MTISASLRFVICRTVLAASVCLTVAAPGAIAAQPASSPPAIEITADEMTVNATTQAGTARGRVRITDGRLTATADQATLYHHEGRAVLSGQARVTGPQGDLEGRQITITYTTRAVTRVAARGAASLDAEGALTSADLITLDPAVGTVMADGEVTVFSQPDIVATGRRLTYDRQGGRLVLDGVARVQNRDGFLQAQRIEGFRRSERIVATGEVHGTFRDVDVRSRDAEVFYGERRAVFTGDVRLTQPGRRLVTERVQLWYDVGRVVAEGQTSIRLEPQP